MVAELTKAAPAEVVGVAILVQEWLVVGFAIPAGTVGVRREVDELWCFCQ